MDPKFPEEVANDPVNRRFDGSLGRFEFTRFPQVFDANRPWIAMLRRDPKPSDRFEDVYDNWINKPLFPRIGSIKRDYLERLRQRCALLNNHINDRPSIQRISQPVWENRPCRPSPDEMARLEGELEYEDAVDRTARIGRQLAEKVAWIEMADVMLKHPEVRELKDFQGSNSDVPPADEDFIGVWLNGANQFAALWFLLVAKVPCFVIHLYKQNIDYPTSNCPDTEDRRCKSASRSFLEGTAFADPNTLNDNPFQKQAIRTNEQTVPGKVKRCGLNFCQLRLDDREADLSSSWEQMRPFQFPNHKFTAFTNQPISSPSSNPPTTLPKHQPSTSSLSQPVSSSNKFNHKELDLVTIDKDRYPWVRPPPVAFVPDGKWSHWEYNTDGEDQPRFVMQSKKPFSYEQSWYDRVHRRTLYLDEDLQIPAGVLNVEKFGAPAPRVKYVVPVGMDDGFKEVEPSYWVYSIRYPGKREGGESAKEPKPEDLRFLTQTEFTRPRMLEDDDYDYGYGCTDGTLIVAPSNTITTSAAPASTTAASPRLRSPPHLATRHVVQFTPHPRVLTPLHVAPPPRVVTPPPPPPQNATSPTRVATLPLPPTPPQPLTPSCPNPQSPPAVTCDEKKLDEGMSKLTVATDSRWNGRSENCFMNSGLSNLTIYLAFEDQALWSDKAPFLPIKVPFWRFRKHANDLFSLLVAVDATTVMEYTLPLPYGPILAFLDISYRIMVHLFLEKVPKAQEISHYMTGLRTAFQEELSLLSSEERAASQWRSVVIQEWACRAYRSYGHSKTGRVTYGAALEEEGLNPAYHEDVLKLGKSFFQGAILNKTPTIVTLFFFRLDSSNHPNPQGVQELG
jgi:hypothetical protein